LKILLVVHSLSAGGAERVAAHLGDRWAERGWQVVLVTMTGRDKDFFATHPSIRRISLGLDGNSANALDAVVNNVRRIRALHRVLRRERPDVAIGMMTTANCLLALAGRGTGIGLIGSERIYPPAYPLGKVWELVRRKTYPLLHAVVALTEKNAEWLREQTGARNLVVIPNPVVYPLRHTDPVVAFEPDPRFRHTLLGVGRLEKQKGFDRLLSAYAQIVPRFPDWRLAIVGEGRCRFELQNQVADLGLEGRVVMPGAVGNIGDWFESADVYVLTSRFEGFPNTLVEALAHGLPAVSVDCETGPSDILRHGIDGLLVRQDDPAALVDALIRLMESSDLRRRFAARAVEARERFSTERIGALWENLFVELKKRCRS
jgi:glycosyltransferase involved in cell wall biosynthesis